MSQQIIDLKEVLERVQEDKELLAELFDIFQEDFVTKRKTLGAAIAARDIPEIKKIVHSMKGSSGNISAKPLHAACITLENMAKEGKTDSMQGVVIAIDGYFEEIKVFAIIIYPGNPFYSILRIILIIRSNNKIILFKVAISPFPKLQ